MPGSVSCGTCVRHRPGVGLPFEAVPVRNSLCASQTAGAVRCLDPCSGHPFAGTRRYVEDAGLAPDGLRAAPEPNARAVRPRPDALPRRRRR
ncbi:hypothetical protein [Streptomyces cinereospinus]|uniref:Uncharacterized protein n=1 Tax=Streptomyces cinereospinus TaxID=285561 RepID=A0ABV5NAP5_9ACTN